MPRHAISFRFWSPIALVMGAFLSGPLAAAQTPAPTTPPAPAQAKAPAPPASDTAKTPAAPTPAAAKGPGAGEVEVDPINCWWRTDKTAVQVGERFTLALTCSVVETARSKTVVDPNQLDASALSVAPFEIVSGMRHEDVVAAPWRYFQYEYSVRVIGNAYFGQDIDIPATSLKYNIVTNIADGEGREQRYVLPALTMRVLSLVPAKAGDIRDSSQETFAEMEGRRRRSTEELVGAAVAFGFAVVLLGLALARAIGSLRKRTPVASRVLSPATLLGASLAAIRRLKADVARDGWTEDLAARALAALRVGGAVVMGRSVAQLPATKNAVVHEGQLPVSTGVLGRRRLLISASTSSPVMEQRLATPGDTTRSAGVASAMGDLQEALKVFSTTRYGRSGRLDTTALDSALERGEGAIRRLRTRSLWRFRKAGALAKAAAVLVVAVWLR